MVSIFRIRLPVRKIVQLPLCHASGGFGTISVFSRSLMQSMEDHRGSGSIHPPDMVRIVLLRLHVLTIVQLPLYRCHVMQPSPATQKDYRNQWRTIEVEIFILPPDMASVFLLQPPMRQIFQLSPRRRHVT